MADEKSKAGEKTGTASPIAGSPTTTAAAPLSAEPVTAEEGADKPLDKGKAAAEEKPATTESASSPPAQQQSPASAGSPSAPVPDILPAHHWTQLAEARERDDDEDSSFDDKQSSTASISSSILEYRTIHGRTYHSDRGNAQYWGSNDERQNEALDMAHHFLTVLLDNKLYLAPLDQEKVQTAIDIGTGTGIWAIDFADEFPNAAVIGTDVSPIQPTWVPPNLQFQIDDCTQEWTFAPDSVDFIHMRWLVGSIVDWPALYKQAFKALKSGGYVEDAEPSPYLVSDDGTLLETHAMNQWGPLFVEGGRRIGRSFTVIEDDTLRAAMEEAGFVDIQETEHKIPMGGWSRDPKYKEIGRYVQLALEQDLEGTMTFMANVLGWSREEILAYGAHLRRELKSGKIHAYYRHRFITGRKP